MKSSVTTATIPPKEPAKRSFKVKAEEHAEPSFENDHNRFFWTYTEEPHRTRRMAIIKAHPEVLRLRMLVEAQLLMYSLGNEALWS